LLCAIHFGWDKYTVDKQPLDYLHRLVIGFIEDSKKGGGAGVTQMKKMGKMLK